MQDYDLRVKEYQDGKRHREKIKQAEDELDTNVYTFKPKLTSMQLGEREGKVEDRLLNHGKRSVSPIQNEISKPSYLNKKSKQILLNSTRSDPFASMKTLKTFD